MTHVILHRQVFVETKVNVFLFTSYEMKQSSKDNLAEVGFKPMTSGLKVQQQDYYRSRAMHFTSASLFFWLSWVVRHALISIWISLFPSCYPLLLYPWLFDIYIWVNNQISNMFHFSSCLAHLYRKWWWLHFYNSIVCWSTGNKCMDAVIVRL